MAHPAEIRQKARRLREEGHSIKEIAHELGIAVGTSSVWLRDIVLSENAQQRLADRRLLKNVHMSETWKRKREAAEQALLQDAKKQLIHLKNNKTIHQLYAALLYWCEGTKGDKAGIVFTNADPILARTFLVLFQKGFEPDAKRIRARVHLHEYHNIQAQTTWWSEQVGIPVEQFYPAYLKPHTGIRKRLNYPGCIAITYSDLAMARRLKALYKAFSMLEFASSKGV